MFAALYQPGVHQGYGSLVCLQTYCFLGVCNAHWCLRGTALIDTLPLYRSQLEKILHQRGAFELLPRLSGDQRCSSCELCSWSSFCRVQCIIVLATGGEWKEQRGRESRRDRWHVYTCMHAYIHNAHIHMYIGILDRLNIEYPLWDTQE